MLCEYDSDGNLPLLSQEVEDDEDEELKEEDGGS